MNEIASQTRNQAQAKPSPLLLSGFLQRQCACGNHMAGGGTCAECSEQEQSLQRKMTGGIGSGHFSTSSGFPLQRKLTIGASDDPLEKEADRVADQVMSMPANPDTTSAPPRIQRFTGQSSGSVGTAPASVKRALSSPGAPLEPGLRQDMESRFGYDFSNVRVHSGSAAEQSAWDVNANAYTLGNNVVFGAGQLSPKSYGGRRLIAHELTHVLQRNLPGEALNGRVMRQPKLVETAYSGCTTTQTPQIDRAVKSAKAALNMAEAIVGSAAGRPDRLTIVHKKLLLDHFHTTNRDSLVKILGTYISIRGAFEGGLKIQCETKCPSEKKDEVTCGYAYNTMWFGGIGPIHICFDTAGCNFATTAARNQTALVIHEAAHRHAGIDDKVYRWKSQYATLSVKQAMDNADSYAWFAVGVWEADKR